MNTFKILLYKNSNFFVDITTNNKTTQTIIKVKYIDAIINLLQSIGYIDISGEY